MNGEDAKENKERGITLLALIVTIIVLMLLSGIILSLLIGQNGVIGKSKEAQQASANADEATTEGLNNLDDEVAEETGEKLPTRVETAIGKKLSDTDNVKLKDDNSNTITIPAGFKIASDSATKQEDGIVIEDKDGNQYVWVPVTDTCNYTRTDFGKFWGGNTYSDFLESLSNDEKASVSAYHGYYIGRYEAGDDISTRSKKMRNTGESTTNSVSIKKGQAPYDFVTINEANTLAIGVKIAEGYKATTKLCSSYAWDTAINFIQNEVSNYGTSSSQGNYHDTTFSYIDISGLSQTKSSGSDILIPTGETVPLCNIYDMGGNEWEWTTEACSTINRPYVFRGGNCYNTYLDYPAGFYCSASTIDYGYDLGFRVTLYM